MLLHWCPGCDSPHGIIIENSEGRPIWKFDGNYNAPTFEPSVRCYTTETTDDNDRPLPKPIERTLCHYFIKAGSDPLLAQREPGRMFDPGKSYIDFCGDSPHALAGKIVELPDWPYAPGTYGGIDE